MSYHADKHISYHVDKHVIDKHTEQYTHTHGHTYAGHYNTQRPRLASCKNQVEIDRH